MLDTPYLVIHRPNPSLVQPPFAPDPLDGLLQTLQPRGAFYHRSELHGAWGLTVLPGPASFHIVLGGVCVVQVAGETHALGTGDVAVLPHGDGYILADRPGRPALSLEVMHARYGGADGHSLRKDGDGPATTLVCGGVAFDHAFPHPLLEALPPVVLVRGGGEAVPWLEHTLGFLACEAASGRPGAETVMGHLASILFIHAVRAYLRGVDAAPAAGPDGAGEGGWLSALGDPHLGPALAALQRDATAPWTVAALAAEAGLSRSAFSARFRAAVGEPPMQHVTRWRMARAAQLLRTEQLSLAQVAAGVGYESGAAFSRAFKRWTGQPPAAFRRGRTASPAPSP